MHPTAVPLPEDNTLTRHRPSLGALTGMRFFLAAYVVLHHTRAGTFLLERQHTFAGTFFINGQIAVAQFFLLSGFILAYTYCGQIETGRHRTRFWQARFARIWPAYAFSLLVCSFVLHTTPPPVLVVASLFMVQGWSPLHMNYAGVWNAVCWTLTVEAFFYLVFPWVQGWLEKLRSSRLRIATVATLLVIVLFNTAPKAPGHAGYSGLFAFVPYPVIHLPEFVLGVVTGNIFLRRAGTWPTRKGWMTYAGLALSVLFLVLPVSPWTSFVMLGFALLTYGLAAEKTLLARMLSTKTMLLGGGLSYSMYLLQTPIRRVFDTMLAHSSPAFFLLEKIALFLALVLVPLAVFLFLEEPSRRVLRRAFDSIDRRLSARA